MPNLFLQSLQEVDRARLVPLLRSCEFEVGDVLTQPDQSPAVVAFPVTARFSREYQTREGAEIQTAWIGPEGLTGALPLLAEAPSPWRIVTRRAGSAWCIEADSLRRLITEGRDLRLKISRLALFYDAQDSISTACAANHSVTSRVARWILEASEEAGLPEIAVTQDEIARLLSAQRTSVVAAFSKLSDLGATRTMRGRITIADRRRLRGAACACGDELHRIADTLQIRMTAPKTVPTACQR